MSKVMFLRVEGIDKANPDERFQLKFTTRIKGASKLTKELKSQITSKRIGNFNHEYDWTFEDITEAEYEDSKED